MPTFITSRAVNETIYIYVQTSTGYWKYQHNGNNSGVFTSGTGQEITVANANGEFTIIPCLANGNMSGDITILGSSENQLTSFDGTGLSGLTSLSLGVNQLTSFDGTGLSGLTLLDLGGNQLTTFDGSGLSSLITLYLNGNQLTTFDGTGLSSLTYLYLSNNQLTSIDITGLFQNLPNDEFFLYLDGNNFTPEDNDLLLSQLVGITASNGEITTSGGRTLISNYNFSELSHFSLTGFDLVIPTTFKTSKTIGQTITPNVSSSTGHWKSVHNGVTSSVFGNGTVTLTVSNSNGEFKIIPCLVDGAISGQLQNIFLDNDQITSFNLTGISITNLGLSNNQVTEFVSGNGIAQLINLSNNGINGSLAENGIALPNNLFFLFLDNNQLTSFDGTGFSSLNKLSLYNNLINSFNGNALSNLTELNLGENLLTTFSQTGLSQLETLILSNNQLTIFNATQSGLTNLYLENNQITDITGIDDLLVSIEELYLRFNPIPRSLNNYIVSKLVEIETLDGVFTSSNGISPSFKDEYDILISRSWYLFGLEVEYPVTIVTSRAVPLSISFYIATTTGFFKYKHNGVFSQTLSTGWRVISITNQNGEFTFVSCSSNGTIEGDVTELNLNNSQITSFDGSEMPMLNYLNLSNNQLTSFNGTGLNSLTQFYISGNGLLTTFNGGNMQITSLYIQNTQLTTFIGGSMSSLQYLILSENQLTSFSGNGLSSLAELYLNNNLLTTLNGSGMISLNYLEIGYNQLTTFNGSELFNLANLFLYNNQLTSFNGSGLSSLTYLNLNDNQISTFNSGSMSNLLTLFITGNNLTSFSLANLPNVNSLRIDENGLTASTNNLILSQLVQYGLEDGEFFSSGGITNDAKPNLQTLFNRGWNLIGLDPPYPVTFRTSNAQGSAIYFGLKTSNEGEEAYFVKIKQGNFVSEPYYAIEGLELEVMTETGEFTVIPCSPDGFPIGELTGIYFNNQNIVEFRGNELNSLTELSITNNSLDYETLFESGDFTFPQLLEILVLGNNNLEEFDGSFFPNIIRLELNDNPIQSIINIPVNLQEIFIALPNAETTDFVLSELEKNGKKNGTFALSTNVGRTRASNRNVSLLKSRGWQLPGINVLRWWRMKASGTSWNNLLGFSERIETQKVVQIYQKNGFTYFDFSSFDNVRTIFDREYIGFSNNDGESIRAELLTVSLETFSSNGSFQTGILNGDNFNVWGYANDPEWGNFGNLNSGQIPALESGIIKFVDSQQGDVTLGIITAPIIFSLTINNQSISLLGAESSISATIFPGGFGLSEINEVQFSITWGVLTEQKPPRIKRINFRGNPKFKSEDETLVLNTEFLILENVPTFETNQEAKNAGYVEDDLYKTSTGELKIVN